MSHERLRRIRGKEIGMVFQDPRSSLNPVRTVGSQMEESIRLHLGLNRSAARRRARDFLGMVGLPSPEHQLTSYPYHLSGGMCQRTMIAMALCCEPRLLICDEPTTALDVSVQAQISDLLRRLASELHASLILISHDFSVVAGMADRVAVMYAGQLVETGDTDQIFKRPKHPYTYALLECIPRLDRPRPHRLRSIPASEIPGFPGQGCRFAPRCPLVMDRCLVEMPRLELREPRQMAACWASLEESSVTASLSARTTRTSHIETSHKPNSESADHQMLLQVKDLTVHFPVTGSGAFLGQREIVHAIDDISFGLAEGETLGLVGESGSGKSTTGRTVLMLQQPTRGQIVFEGQNISALSDRAMRRLRPRMQIILQDPYSALDPRMKVGELIAEPLVVHDIAPQSRLGLEVSRLLGTVGLDERYADRYPHELSGGQRQRVCIARALGLRPSLVVADEPTSALDVSIRADILNLMLDLQGQFKLSYLFISHDMSVVRQMSNRIAVMYLGKIVEVADTDTLFRNPSHPYTRALLSAVPIPDPAIERHRRGVAIQGEVPSPIHPPTGCRFHTRCPMAFDRCREEEPALQQLGRGHQAACFLAEQLAREVSTEFPSSQGPQR
jgi:oligopeptide/dipeptide ABC transporter ATP-binding protein